jgi:hypothetical protein
MYYAYDYGTFDLVFWSLFVFVLFALCFAVLAEDGAKSRRVASADMPEGKYVLEIKKLTV